MTTIAILPEKVGSFRAVAGKKESSGRTVGEALDALTAQLPDDENNLLVIIQNHKADEFFNSAQQQRLTELMEHRAANNLTADEENELEQLIEDELKGAQQRAQHLSGGLLP